MGDSFYGVFNGMGKIIHGINTPFVPGIVMGHMGHPVENGIPHVNIRGSHINSCPKNQSSVFVFAVFHVFKKLKIFLNASSCIGIFSARLCQSSPVLTHLFRRQIRHIGFALFNQLHCPFIHLFKIVGSKKQVILPVCSQPLDILFDGLHKFRFFFGGIRVVETHMKFAMIFLCQTIVQQDRFGMSYMKTTIRFRWKTCPYRLTISFL